jgi:hypothetical protein
MGLTVTVAGLDKLVASFLKIPGIAQKNMRTAAKEGANLIRRESATHHKYKSHTGHASKAYRVTVLPTGMGAEIALDGAISQAPYVFPLHEGHKAYDVYPKHKKALYWVKGGREFIVLKKGWKNPKPKPGWMIRSGLLGGGKGDGQVWSHKGFVHIPAAPGEQFLYNAANAKRSECVALMTAAMAKTIKEAGF